MIGLFKLNDDCVIKETNFAVLLKVTSGLLLGAIVLTVKIGALLNEIAGFENAGRYVLIVVRLVIDFTAVVADELTAAWALATKRLLTSCSNCVKKSDN